MTLTAAPAPAAQAGITGAAERSPEDALSGLGGTGGLSGAVGLACDESVLTGEPLPVDKSTASVPDGTALADLVGCALMSTMSTRLRRRSEHRATTARFADRPS